MLRALIHHGRTSLAVAAACAITTAVLTGALTVGDSVRGSLRDMTLDRLGEIEAVVVSDRVFDEELADALPGSVAMMLARGAATHGDSGARAASVQVLGVDEAFFGLWPDSDAPDLSRAPDAIFPPVVLNAALATELGAVAGDDVVLTFARHDAIPRDSLMGDAETDAVLARMRATVAHVVPDRGPGRFALAVGQHVPRNAIVSSRALQRALERPRAANALLLPVDTVPEDPMAALDAAMSLDRHGLDLTPRDGYVVVESAAYVLRPEHEEAVLAAADALGLPAQRLVSYLANELRVGDRAVPYSGITGVDASVFLSGSRLVLEGGRPAPAIPSDGILLNRWTADDLGARPGDELRLTYYVVGARERVRAMTTTLRVAGIVTLEGLGGDRRQAPEYPGLDDAPDMQSWDPPFPVDLERIRPRDEDYWDDYGATPKAFVALETATRLWATRYGATTQIRVPTPEGGVEALAREILARLDPADSGLAVRDVRARGLAASAGATDFAGLFLGFSWFLIVAAAMLVGLLFGLGVERRAREIGVLLAVGYRVRRVRARLLAEALAVGLTGALAGTVLAIGYGALMISGLRTLWVGAVGSTDLTLHVVTSTLVTGIAVSLVVILVAVAGSVLRLSRLPPPRLLAGDTRKPGAVRSGRTSFVLAWGGAAGAVALIATAFLRGRDDDPVLAFGAGALALVSGLAAFSRWTRSPAAATWASARGIVTMAARNAAWNPGRSLLSVALVACAAFVLVLVAANHATFGDELLSRESGTGGYTVYAEADLALLHDLNTETGRLELGLSEDRARALRGVPVQPLRLLPGDDASCLNLYRPESPRIVGLPDDFLDRGGFTFRAHAPLPDGSADPWALLAAGYDDPDVVPAVADANSAQWILKVGLGDEIVVDDDAGGEVRLRLVGLLDTSIFQGEILIGERAFLRHFPSRTGYGAFLLEAPKERVQEVAETLEAGLAAFGLDAVSTRARLEAYKRVENTYLSTFQLLGGLGLLLGTVGLAIVMVRNVLERRAELATLRAFGFRRASVARMVLAENAYLLGKGVGIGTFAALLAVMPRLARIEVPWVSLAATLGAILVFGLVSAIAAVRGALATPLLPELKAER